MLVRKSCLSLLVCAGSALAAPGAATGIAGAQAALSRLPLRFEANQGQWNPEVRYAARSGSGALFLTGRGAALSSGSRRVDIGLFHANPAPQIEALDRLPLRTNYFVGTKDQWRRGVANFARVAYRSVYPGIDVIYYGNRDQLEYDFVLQPGADPRSIRLQFRGADKVSLTPQGDLLVEAGGARLVQKQPVIYQQDALTAELRPVEGRYELRGQGMVGLRLGAYDRTRALTVDPVVSYSLFVGGGAADVITAVATDSQGFLYACGSTLNADLQSVGITVQAGYNAGMDGFVMKIDPNAAAAASVVYLTYLGGARDDAVTAIYVDPTGIIYATGTTTSSDFPLAGANVQTMLSLSATDTSLAFPTDAFVTIIGVNDGLEYSTYYGGTANETPNGIGVDQNGLIYILGTTTSPDLPVTSTAIQSTQWGTSDLFVAVIDRNSTTLVYGSYLGGESDDDGRGFAVTPDGKIYFAASTYSTQFPTAGPAYRGAPLGVENIVVGMLDVTQAGAAGLVYCTYFGGSQIDEVRHIELDANRRLLMTGWTLSPDFPVTAKAMRVVYGGAGNAFVARVNPGAQPNAFLEYSTYLGGTGGDVGYGATSDASGAIYVTGYTVSADFPVTGDAVQTKWGNGIDAFLVKFNPAVAGSAALQYGTYLGGTGTHVGASVVLAPDGSVFLGGYTTGDLVLPGLQNGYGGGASDGFVAVVKLTTVARDSTMPGVIKHTTPHQLVSR